MLVKFCFNIRQTIAGDDIKEYPPVDGCPPWEISAEINPMTDIRLPSDCRAVAWIDKGHNLREAVIRTR